MKQPSFATRAVHAGERAPRPDFTPVATPIYTSVGYLYENMDDADAVLGSQRPGYVYARYTTPTLAAFEQAVASLENAPAAQAYASGMAAIHAALLAAVRSVGFDDVCITSALQLTAEGQPSAQGLLTGLRVEAGLFGQLGGGLRQRDGDAPAVSAFEVGRQAKGVLDPAGEGVSLVFGERENGRG